MCYTPSGKYQDYTHSFGFAQYQYNQFVFFNFFAKHFCWPAFKNITGIAVVRFIVFSKM